MKTYGKLRYFKGYWIFSKIEPHVMIRIKNIFPRVAKGQTCPFMMKHSPETAVDIAWFIDRYPLTIKPEHKQYLTEEKEAHIDKINSLERFFKPDYQVKVFDLKKPPRHYQSQAAELFHVVKRLLLGDVVGLGKTITAITTWCDPATLPAAVVVQTHLPNQWKEKIAEFSNLSVHIVHNGPPYQLPPADVYIFKYNQIAKWIDILKTGIVKSVTFDEIQELRREDSQKYRSSKEFADSLDYVMGMSATPVYNYGDEIWNIYNIIKPDALGPKVDFLREWCKGYGSIVSDPKALGAYLRSNNLFLRRTREEVGLELPPVNRIVETVDYDSEAIEKIEEVAQRLAVKVLSGSFVEKGQAARDLDMMVRHATGVSKAKPVAQYVRMIVEAGEPVLLAGWHRDVYDIWAKEFEGMEKPPVMYTGSETPKQKDEAKRAFMAGESDLMMISLRSGIGLDGLQQRAKIVVIGELDWSPQIHEQIIGRLNRDGQQGQVTVIFLVSDSGSDPGIVEMLGLKSSQAQGITDPFAKTEITHSDSSRIQDLAKRFLEHKARKQMELPIGGSNEVREGEVVSVQEDAEPL